MQGIGIVTILSERPEPLKQVVLYGDFYALYEARSAILALFARNETAFPRPPLDPPISSRACMAKSEIKLDTEAHLDRPFMLNLLVGGGRRGEIDDICC